MAQDRTAAKGTWGTVEWALDARLGLPARDFFIGLPESDQTKIAALFARLAAEGRIQNVEKFKALGAAAGGLFEFKSFQVRFLGDFRPGKRFLVAHGLRKKKDVLDVTDIQVALRILRENDQVERRK
jgi:hypothetical protein